MRYNLWKHEYKEPVLNRVSFDLNTMIPSLKNIILVKIFVPEVKFFSSSEVSSILRLRVKFTFVFGLK